MGEYVRGRQEASCRKSRVLLYERRYHILCEYVLRPYLRQKTGNSFIIDSEKKLGFTRDELVEALTYIKDCYDWGVFEPAEDQCYI